MTNIHSAFLMHAYVVPIVLGMLAAAHTNTSKHPVHHDLNCLCKAWVGMTGKLGARNLTWSPELRETAMDSPVSDDSSIFRPAPLPISCKQAYHRDVS